MWPYTKLGERLVCGIPLFVLPNALLALLSEVLFGVATYHSHNWDLHTLITWYMLSLFLMEHAAVVFWVAGPRGQSNDPEKPNTGIGMMSAKNKIGIALLLIGAAFSFNALMQIPDHFAVVCSLIMVFVTWITALLLRESPEPVDPSDDEART